MKQRQPSLFETDPPLGYARKGNKTQEAAVAKLRRKLPTQKSLVLRTIRIFSRNPKYQGATRYEIAELTRLPIQSICARIGELLSENAILRTDRTRPSPYGHDAQVFVAVPDKDTAL